jgi:hypothetical protein
MNVQETYAGSDPDVGVNRPFRRRPHLPWMVSAVQYFPGALSISGNGGDGSEIIARDASQNIPTPREASNTL